MDIDLSDPSGWVLWQDDDLVVVDKPARLPTLVDGWQPEAPFLVGLLKQIYPALWVVHRLDRDTSGVIVFARNAEAHRALNTQFEWRGTQKIYHALVAGLPPWEQVDLRMALRVNAGHKHRTVVDPRRGRPAHTEARVLERYGGVIKAALVEAILHTGRTHQIRAHLAAAGFPLLGDRLYGGPEGVIERTALHACSLRVRHPRTEDEMMFEAPYPQDFREARERLLQG